MSKKRLSFQLPKISLREAAESEDAAFEQMDSPIWDLPVYSLDKFPSIKSLWKVKCSIRCPKETCAYRDELKTPYVQKDLKTADALYLAPDKKIYFIEFKAQPSGNVDDDDICGKAFESLYAAALSALGDCPMEKIRANAEFIVVFKETSDKTRTHYTQKSAEGFKEFSKKVQGLAHLLDEVGNPIYFNLDRFKARTFYRDVHTFDQGQFEQWATQKHLVAPAEA